MATRSGSGAVGHRAADCGTNFGAPGGRALPAASGALALQNNQ